MRISLESFSGVGFHQFFQRRLQRRDGEPPLASFVHPAQRLIMTLFRLGHRRSGTLPIAETHLRLSESCEGKGSLNFPLEELEQFAIKVLGSLAKLGRWRSAAMGPAYYTVSGEL